MKLKLPEMYVPYGPVGHPEARPYVHMLGNDKDDVWREFYDYLERRSSQPDVPVMFYDRNMPMEAQGYHIVPVVNGNEILDEVLAELAPHDVYMPAQPGQPGRNLQAVRNHLPSYLNLADKEIWPPGTSLVGCDHDIGLESYSVYLKEEYTDRVLNPAEMEEGCVNRNLPDGQYYSTFRCTRCGEHQAYPQT